MEGRSARCRGCHPRPVPRANWPAATCVVFLFHFVGVIVGLVLEPLPGAAIAITGLTAGRGVPPICAVQSQQLSEPGFRPPSAALAWALSGYSNPTVWLIFGAFILALGYERTGLGETDRALILVKRMGKNTLLLGYGVTLADTILAPFIPSPTARSGGIIYPIVSDLAQVYESKPKRPFRAPGWLLSDVGSYRNHVCNQFAVSHRCLIQSARRGIG